MLRYADGKIYKGHWEKTRKHGFHHFRFFYKFSRWILLNIFNSFGVLFMTDGEKIEGKWTNNKLNGTVIFTESNGERFEENYRVGIPDGSRKPLKKKGKIFFRSTIPISSNSISTKSEGNCDIAEK